MKKLALGLFGIAMIFNGSANALAETDTKEEYLPIPELNQTIAPKITDDNSSIFDDVRLHAGAAFIDSFQDFKIAPGIRQRGAVSGAQLNFGVDLFDTHWIVEGDLVNIPQTAVGDTRLSTNGFELRLLYETAILEGVTVHAAAGVASRNYDIITAARTDGSVSSGEQTFSSGATVLAAGIDYWVSGQMSAGIEFDNHLPMASGDDPSSIDIAVRLNGHF